VLAPVGTVIYVGCVLYAMTYYDAMTPRRQLSNVQTGTPQLAALLQSRVVTVCLAQNAWVVVRDLHHIYITSTSRLLQQLRYLHIHPLAEMQGDSHTGCWLLSPCRLLPQSTALPEAAGAGCAPVLLILSSSINIKAG
jgi:hypothetical protein